MAYYHVPTLTARNPGQVETKLSDGAPLSPPERGWTHVLAAACGFVPIDRVARPADTATDKHVRSVDVGTARIVTERQVPTAWDADGEPTAFGTVQVPPAAEGRALEVWTAVPKTLTEIAAESLRNTEDSNRSTIEQQELDALATLRAYLDLGAPTMGQATAMIDVLARNQIGIIRRLLEQYDGVD